MTYTNNICYAGNNGSNSLVGDYLTGPDAPYAGNVNPIATNNLVAWNSIMALATPGDTIIVPPGFNAFGTKPSPPPNFVKVQGAGSYSALVRNYAPSGTEDIFIEVAPQYSTFENLLIISDDRYPGGIAIGHMATSPVNCAYGPRLINIIVSYFHNGGQYGDGRFFGACKFNGVAGAPNYGARDIRILDCLFKSSYYGLLGIGCNAITANALTIPEAPGAGIWLIGVGSPSNPTTESYISGVLECSINLQNTRTTRISGTTAGAVSIDAGCSGCTVDVSYIAGAPTLAGVNNHVAGNGARWDV